MDGHFNRDCFLLQSHSSMLAWYIVGHYLNNLNATLTIPISKLWPPPEASVVEYLYYNRYSRCDVDGQ